MPDIVLKWLETIGFKKQPNTSEYQITLGRTNYCITVNYNLEQPEKSVIDYGNLIKVHRKTTSDFHQSESLVVLECVIRLLEKGYEASSIELEKPWALGHKDGYLDILVKDPSGKSFLMIDCKTWGKKYEEAIEKTKRSSKNGGQLFSYLQQDPKHTRAICYYASTIENGRISYQNHIIYNKKEWANLNQEERYAHWSGSFELTGIFDEWVTPYGLSSSTLKKKNLTPLTKQDGVDIFYKFTEILRHNVISDKSNAFNKIINLFLCKIYDENRSEDDELLFQIRVNNRDKTNEELFADLNELYRHGMSAYLKVQMSGQGYDYFEKLIKNVPESIKKVILEEYNSVRIYQSNTFAFKEVYDKQSFEDNAIVVREIVELLQGKQIKYTQKQQFLGQFFEQLLNVSIKQESGQFFTPVPLAQFIIKSIPFKSLIESKIGLNEDNILPYVLDYACGAGHFLTESMEEIQNIIRNEIDPATVKKPTVKQLLEVWKNTDYLWVKDYIYGIDFDHRLTKTTKINCFMNGDGEANIICADGLAPYSSPEYIGALHKDHDYGDNPNFDVLITNPPYAVEGFKNKLVRPERFDLAKTITDKSNEIEVLFIERAKQIVKTGGYVGIILPAGILSKDTNAYKCARKMILTHFDVISIVSLEDKTFAATGTRTVILFMRRRNDVDESSISDYVNQFFDDYEEKEINGHTKPISEYARDVHDMSILDYVSILNYTPTESASESELWNSYKDKNPDDICYNEKEKLKCYIHSMNTEVIIANPRDKDDQKIFLGYEFSSRRRSEGIHVYRHDDDTIDSKLFSDISINDPNKINTYIRRSFLGKDVVELISSIEENPNHELNGRISIKRLNDLVDYDTNNFIYSVSTIKQTDLKFETKWPSEKLSKHIVSLETGSRKSPTGVKKRPTGIISLGGANISSNGRLVFKEKWFISEDEYEKQAGKIEKGDILICKDGALTGKVAFVDDHYPYQKSSVNEHVYVLRTDSRIYQKYLFYVLLSQDMYDVLYSKCKKSAQSGMRKNVVNDLLIPNIEEKIQLQIIAELDAWYKMQNNPTGEETRSYVQNVLNKYLR